MWDRKELKAKGKEAYRKNRVMCILAALLLTVASGAGGATTGSSASNVVNKQDNTPTYNQDAGDDFGYGNGDQIVNDLEEDFGFNDDGTIEGDGDFGYKDDSVSQSDAGIAAVIAAGIVGVILIIVIIIASLLSIFLLNPLTVGLRKFFTENATDPKASLNKNNIGLAFSDKYMNVVGSMFTTKLFTFLWALLLIVPGIYKAFQWRMVPFIVSENPGITGKEAREQSKAMMDGSKWKAFVMDLSFLGWKLLGGLTLGILNLVFTNPYQAATESELWLHLSGRPTPPLALEAAPAAPAAPAPEAPVTPVTPAPAVEPVVEAAPAPAVDMAPEAPAAEPAIEAAPAAPVVEAAPAPAVEMAPAPEAEPEKAVRQDIVVEFDVDDEE